MIQATTNLHRDPAAWGLLFVTIECDGHITRSYFAVTDDYGNVVESGPARADYLATGQGH